MSFVREMCCCELGLLGWGDLLRFKALFSFESIFIRKFIFSELLFPDSEVFEVENKLFGHVPEPIDVIENISYSDLHKVIE